MTRAQMAVFLLKSKFGSAHIPPPCTGTVFTDVPCTGGAFDPWIEELAALQITGGCGGTDYCPEQHRHPPADGRLPAQGARRLDVRPARLHGHLRRRRLHPGTGFSDWIEELYNRGDHGRLLHGAALLLPDQPEQPRPDGGVSRQDVRLVLYGG